MITRVERSIGLYYRLHEGDKLKHVPHCSSTSGACFSLLKQTLSAARWPRAHPIRTFFESPPPNTVRATRPPRRRCPAGADPFHGARAIPTRLDRPPIGLLRRE